MGRPTGAYSDVLDIHDSIQPREGHEHSLPFDDKARRMLIFLKNKIIICKYSKLSNSVFDPRPK